ncbi:UNVERIFIED_CONTAM: Coenzyme Q-binding protein COQ10, mitochondrial [Sesamum angustifolium]|uniref:Coenzyme Q-binding protein COQ10, mitochondrial n=1 Tax=Sesamum angustifolium TaxID=2727405 RepID=A0AAW2L795_9LAMI
MPPFNPAPKALARSLVRRNWFRQRMRNCCSYNQIRCLSSVAGTNVFASAGKTVGGYRNSSFLDCGNSSSISNVTFQKRGFLGCGDGQEGNVLAKVYEERRVLGYSPEQLFNVVAAVDMYEDFLPWCQRSEIVRRNPDGSFDAELEIGFKFLVESYISHVELHKPKSIKTTSSQSTLFDHLINVWEFNPGPVPGSCNLYFLVTLSFNHHFIDRGVNG